MVGTATALALAGGTALASGISGAMGSNTTQNQTSGVNLNPASALQNQSQNMVSGNMSDLQGLVDKGPGGSDVSSYLDDSHSLASMLQQYSQNGGMPGQQDIDSSNNIASNLFGAQRTQLQQNFQDQGYQANQQAALMGRSANDPILRNKLAQEQTRQQAMLQSQQGGLAQQLALQQPMQRLGFAQQRNQVLGGLASQALANRQALASMGQSVLGQQQQYQLATSQHYGTQSQSSGGGVGGAINGAMGGFGTGMSLAGMLSSFGGAGAGGGGNNMNGSNLGGYFGGANPYSGSSSFSSAPSFGMAPLSPSYLSGGYGQTKPSPWGL